MATVDEILSTMADGSTDYTAVCEIDWATRVINIPPAISVLGVESDDDVRRIHFIMPSTYGEHDLSEFEININFLNAVGQGDIYTVEDQAVTDGMINFSWVVGRTAFAYKGDVKFIVCLKKRNVDLEVVQELNTTVATLEVLEGLEVADAIAEHNPDVIEEILLKLHKAEMVSINLTNGEATGSLRTVGASREQGDYKLGEHAMAFGYTSDVPGQYAFAEGAYTEAAGEASHAEGYNTHATGENSHAEGCETYANGQYAHAEGLGTEANGLASHAEGYVTKARGWGQHVQGMYNVEDVSEKYLHIVGNGNGDQMRSNAHTIDRNGNGWFAGGVYAGGTDQDNAEKLLTAREVRDLINSSICIVHMTAGTDDTMSTFTYASKDKTYADVKRVYDNGGHVAVRVQWLNGPAVGTTMEAQLVSYAADTEGTAFIFAFGANPMIVFKSDDTVTISNE